MGLLSSEITSFRVPTTWSDGEGNTYYSAMRAVERPGGALESDMCGHLLHGNREIHRFSSNHKEWKNGHRRGKPTRMPCAAYGSRTTT